MLKTPLFWGVFYCYDLGMLSKEYGRFSTYKLVPDRPLGHVLVVPGFAESLQQTKPIVKALADKDLAAYTYSQPRLGTKEDGVLVHPLQRQGKVALMALNELLPGHSKVTAVAHSLGTAAVLKAVQLNPERFDTLILMQPIGLAGEQPFTDLFRRSLRKNRNNYKTAKDMTSLLGHKSVAKAQFGSMTTITKQPLLAIREAMAIGDYSIMEDIKSVVDNGIKVHLVISKFDEYFDYDKMQNQIEDLDNIVTSITLLDEPHHGHDINWLDPALTATLTIKLLAQS